MKAGILVPFIEGSKGDLDHAFDSRDLDDLLVRLVREAEPVGAEDGNVVSVCKAATRACVSGVDVGRLLLDGRLATVRLDPGERAFAAIRVDPGEVSRATKPERGGPSLREVEKRMESSTGVVKALVGLNLRPASACLCSPTCYGNANVEPNMALKAAPCSGHLAATRLAKGR